MSRFQASPGWQDGVLAAWRALAGQTLGPEIEADAKGYCPVLTGDLLDSIEHHMNGDVLVIKGSGSDERFYCAYVEMGHAVFHPSTRIVGPERVPAQPFLRPALYQIRRP